VTVKIFDDEEYEKNEDFFITLNEPALTRRGSGKSWCIHCLTVSHSAE